MIVFRKFFVMWVCNVKFIEDRVDVWRGFGIMMLWGDLWDGVMEGMFWDEMISNVSVIVFVGSEILVMLLSGCMWLLLWNFEVLGRLMEYVWGLFGDELEIDLISVGKLDYMFVVLDEVLRLYLFVFM